VFETDRPIAHVARDLGLPSETIRKYVRQVEADESCPEREDIKALRKEVYELRRADESLKAASASAA
jgi:transposase